MGAQFRNNYLFYHTPNKQYQMMKTVLNNLGITYKEIKMYPNLITKDFVVTLIEHCDEGFDDIIKNPKKSFIDKNYEDFTFNEMVEYITKNYETVLKSAIFFGRIGGSSAYKVTTGAIEDDFTVHIPYEHREMSKIYG
jgi:arsenate reductase-like glutaredoxin family protein